MIIASLDTETLDLSKTTTVVQDIGLVLYDTDTKEYTEHGIRPCIIEQVLRGRTVGDKTVTFHSQLMGGDEKLLAHLRGSDVYKTMPILASQKLLKKLIEPAEELWINGLSFDPVVLDTLYSLVDAKLPWYYRKEVDVRTINSRVLPALRKLTGAAAPEPTTVAHDAIADAKWNIQIALEFRKHLDDVGTMLEAIKNENT